MGKGSRGYIIAAALGALGGGAIVALATKAIPKMMSGMMRNMMRHMEESGCEPAMIGQQMMGLGEAQEKGKEKWLLCGHRLYNPVISLWEKEGDNYERIARWLQVVARSWCENVALAAGRHIESALVGGSIPPILVQKQGADDSLI